LAVLAIRAPLRRGSSQEQYARAGLERLESSSMQGLTVVSTGSSFRDNFKRTGKQIVFIWFQASAREELTCLGKTASKPGG
jgi:hypothetical protein